MRGTHYAVGLLVVLAAALPALGADWTWTPTSGNLWSTVANWTPDGPPTSANTTGIIFDTAFTSNLDGAMILNGITFNASGVLSGPLLYNGQTVDTGYNITLGTPTGGPNAYITVTGANNVTIHNAIFTPNNGTTVVTVADAAGVLTIDGHIGYTGGTPGWLVKNGPGTLIDTSIPGAYYGIAQTNGSIKFQVNDGTLIAGQASGWYWDSGTSTWKSNTQSKYSGTAIVGDGIGAAESAVFRHQAGMSNPYRNLLALITVNSDGWWDGNGIGGDTLGGDITINGGKVTFGGARWYFKDGTVVTMTGGLLDGGTATGDGIIMYAGSSYTILEGASGQVATITGNKGKISGAPAITVADTPGAAVDLEFSLGLYNTGGINKNGPGVMRTSGNNTNTGTNSIHEGTLLVDGACTGQGTYNVASGATLGGTGSITLKAPVVAGTPSVTTPQAVFILGGATLAPGTVGSAARTLTINRTSSNAAYLALGETGNATPAVLALDAASASAYDSIATSAAVYLTGVSFDDAGVPTAGSGKSTLDVNVAYMATFAPTDELVILYNTGGAAITGTFDVPAAPVGGKLQLGTYLRGRINYTADVNGEANGDDVVLYDLDTPYGLNGDTNWDYHVNISDLTKLSNNYGKPGTWTWFDGDFNNDSILNVSDLTLMANNYGKYTDDVVPEPMTLGLLALGGLALIRRKRA